MNRLDQAARARILHLLCEGNSIRAVSFFQKKQRKTPASEITLALKRKKEIELERATPVSVSVH